MPRSTARNNREVHRRPIDLQADEGLISLLRDQPPSTAQRFGGTGLGLAITRKPARMGSLRATVRPQGGQHGQHDASDHHYPRGDPSRWRLVRPGTLVLGRSSGTCYRAHGQRRAELRRDHWLAHCRSRQIVNRGPYWKRTCARGMWAAGRNLSAQEKPCAPRRAWEARPGEGIRGT
jgi:hypothetical protein